MGFEEEATESPDQECIPRGFPRNLLFVRGVGREELREDPSGDDDGEGFLRCMFVVGSTGWLTDVPRRRRARSVWRHGRFRCLSSCTNSFLRPLSLRVATYECISRPRQHSTRWLLLSAGFDPRDGKERTAASLIKEIDSRCFSRRLNLNWSFLTNSIGSYSRILFNDICLHCYTQVFKSKSFCT